MENNKLKILVVAHGHPDLSKGGGEIAAYNLYKGLKEHPHCEALFLGAQPNGSWERGTPLSVRRPGEMLMATRMTDFFRFASSVKQSIWDNFSVIIESFKPDVVHFHHYIHLGIEAIRAVHNVNPNIKIIITIHEYLPICHQAGQMIKKHTHQFCYEANYEDCHKCFPEFTPQDFFMRERFIKSFFNLANLYISPSNFLKDRMVHWGLPAEKIEVLENALPYYEVPNINNDDEEEIEEIEETKKVETTEFVQIIAKSSKPKPKFKIKNKFAFFGQLNPFKGIDILFKAVELLPEEYRNNFKLHIHGSGLEHQSPEFRQNLERMLQTNKDCITFHGSYEPQELPYLMQNIDWVIIPSIWWENSPVVIQEAFMYKRPLICSDIGGMAEKIQHNVTGIHFKARNAQSLSDVLQRALDGKIDWKQLQDNIVKPLDSKIIVDKHIEFYKNC